MMIECPKCGSTAYDCADTENNPFSGLYWEYCYCEDCGAEFTVEYVVSEITLNDED